MSRCPVCENGIEPGKVVACVRCFALFPRKEQQRIREIYVRAKKNNQEPTAMLSGKIEKLVRLTRERYPETRPTNLRDKNPLGPSPIVGIDLAAGPDQTTHITIE